jgi:hypothetical protein
VKVRGGCKGSQVLLQLYLGGLSQEAFEDRLITYGYCSNTRRKWNP